MRMIDRLCKYSIHHLFFVIFNILSSIFNNLAEAQKTKTNFFSISPSLIRDQLDDKVRIMLLILRIASLISSDLCKLCLASVASI